MVDLRVSRTESVGKKSVQSVVAEQGARVDVGKKPTSKDTIIEGESLSYPIEKTAVAKRNVLD